jgi:undecaprenyl-diphosphatase
MVVLAIVQGLSEFLPISSSGHLIVVRELFGWQFSDNLTFDVALHLGTTAAVLIYFWREWLAMARAGVRWVRSGGRDDGPPPYDTRLLLLLILGTVPAGIAGLFEAPVEDHVRSPIVVGVMLIVFAFVLLWAERSSRGERSMASVGWRDALLVGCAQAVALIPGVSRSGITITASLRRGLSRDAAARFSFLLSTPVILGAGGLKFGDAIRSDLSGHDFLVMGTGAAVAAVVGWLAIHFLLRLIRRGTYEPFVAYRVLAGIAVLVWFSIR